MFRVLKYLRESKLAVALILVLLIVQAYSDLTLPQYTSSIVDIGIQQSGIEDAAATRMRAQTMDDLRLFMTEEERALADAYYRQDADGDYVLQDVDAQDRQSLSEALTMPWVMLSSIGSAAAEGAAGQSLSADMQILRAANAAGMLPGEQVMQARAGIQNTLTDVDGSLLTQRAIAAVRAEYEAMGMDLGRLQTNYLLSTGLKMLGVTLVMVGAAVLVGLLSARTGAKIGRDLRGRVFGRVVAFSNADMDTFSTASLITRSTNDIQQVQMVSVIMLRMVLYSPILGIGGVLKVVGTRTGMSWIIAVGVAAVMVLVVILITVAMPKFKAMQTLMDRINLVAREILTGILVIRAFDRQAHENSRFDAANTNLMKTQLFTNRVMTFMMPMMMMVMNCITLMIVWFGAKGIDIGTLQVGSMIAFITYTMQIIMSFLMLSIISVMLPRASVAAGRIDEVLNTQPSIVDKAGASKADAKTDWRGAVAFEGVSFRYPDAEECVLRDISFTASPGQTTAIIGGTGSGKSTLLNLVPRFFDVTEGRITLDGIDIRDMTQHTLREQLGYVPQKGVLFSGDIESNIKYGGDAISDANMVQAAKIAQADGFIEEKSEKYHAPIAQGGTNVSGGQKQRISIARALAKHPKVLLFDDSFSALDYRTDAALRHALSAHAKDATVLIVAQRISTILHANQILVLEEGRIAGIGTHEELLAGNEAYQEIARSQLSEAELKGGKGA